MARRRKQLELHAGELNLTAMIDVAFQLLNFFVITTHPIDVFANLDVFRPQGEETKSQETPQFVEIMVYKDGYVLEKKNVELAEIDRQLMHLAQFDKNTPIVIKCTEDSNHLGLVNVLDLCAKAGLTKISVFSL